jgi:hypothetical protein
MKYCTTANKNIGIKSSFMCSQVDSFTDEKSAATLLPVQSYKKCSIVPSSEETAKPRRDQREKDLFISHRPNVFFISILKNALFYAKGAFYIDLYGNI